MHAGGSLVNGRSVVIGADDTQCPLSTGSPDLWSRGAGHVIQHTCVSGVVCGRLWQHRASVEVVVPDRHPTPIGAPLGLAPRTPPSSHADESPPAPSEPEHPPIGLPSWGKRRVLLLNATFEPLTALPLRRAVVLVVCGKAEVVHGDPSGIELHSATDSVVLPSVIRLAT